MHTMRGTRDRLTSSQLFQRAWYAANLVEICRRNDLNGREAIVPASDSKCPTET